MITGTVHDLVAGGDRYVALVLLDGEDEPREIAYWPELYEQWGADKLRRYLLVEAGRQRDAEIAAAAAAAVPAAQLAELGGAGTADPSEFEPKEAPEHG